MHSEAQWRYRARRIGLRLVRRSRSLGSEQYGPYSLVEQTTGNVVAVKLSPEDVEQLLFGESGTQALATRELPAQQGELQAQQDDP